MSGYGAYIRRAIIAAILGGLAGVAFAVLTYALRPSIEVHFDRDLPRQMSGFYPAERNDRGPFIWTTAVSELRLPGLDRREPWTWVVSARGARPDPRTFPDVTLAVDGVGLLTRRLGNTFDVLSVELPVRAIERGATLTIDVRPPFSPGPDDPRLLGIQIDRMSLAPSPGSGVVLPPRQVLAAAGANGAVFGAAFGLLGVTPGSAVLGAFALAAAQAVPLTSRFGPFTRFPGLTIQLAVWIAALLIVFVAVAERARRAPLRNTARFAAAFSAGALFLELLVLLHPDKAIVDAVFHAHKLGGILQGGTWLLTSVAPGGYEFPYPALLYLVAAPFTTLTSNHVALLRILAATASAAAGLLVYLMIARVWGDRLSAAIAVALYHLIPIGFAVQGSANLTNAFGQSLSVAAIAAVVLAHPAGAARMLALALLMAAAFLSHTSSFVLLAATAVATGVAYLSPRQAQLRAAGRTVLAATTLAVLVAVVLYYGRFGDLYREQFTKISSRAAAASTGVSHPAGGSSAADRIRSVPRFVSTYLGIPFLVLAGWGAFRIWRMHLRDRLGLALLAWIATCAVFLIVGLVTPLDFRHYLAVYPAVAILAAAGAASGWRGGVAPRIAAIVLLAWCVAEGLSEWFGQL